MTTWTLWQTSAAICVHDGLPWYSYVSLMDRQCPVPWHQLDLWQLKISSSYPLTGILGWTPVHVIIQSHYVYRSPYIWPSTYATQSLDPMVHLEDHIT